MGVIDELKLRDFIAWVRYREEAGLPLDRGTLEYVADGIERLLDNKTPWPKPRGNKPQPESHWLCYWLCDFSGEYPNEYKTKRHKEGGIYSIVGKRLHLDASTVESHAKKGREKFKTPEGKREFLLWLSKHKGAHIVRYTPSTDKEVSDQIKAD